MAGSAAATTKTTKATSVASVPAAPTPAPVKPAPSISQAGGPALSLAPRRRASAQSAPLAPGIRILLERRLGENLAAVRVHRDPDVASTLDAAGARAVTMGANIFLASQENPSDLGLMAHEVAHVLQQRTSRKPQAKGISAGNDALEMEADHVSAAIQEGRTTTVQGAVQPSPQFKWGILGSVASAIGGGIRAAAGAVADVAGNVIGAAVKFIKERARSIPGYDVLGFILGRDPITQEPVERNATNLLKAVFALIPGGAQIFQNLQEAKVIERAYQWVTGELTRLNLTWTVIRGAIDRLLNSLGAGDLLNLGGVLERARAIFGPIVHSVTQFALSAGRKIMEFIFEGALSLAGSAGKRILAIFWKIGDTFRLIVNDPVGFLRNLIEAVAGGFKQFGANILQHLKTAIFEWLFGALQGAGIQLPQRFDLAGILSIVLQVLGLTYARLREKLVKLIDEKPVSYIEQGFEFLRILLTQGIAAAWQKILEFAGNLTDMVIDGIKNWVRNTIVGKAIVQIASMLNPAGAIIQACIKIYDTVMFVIERAKQIAAFVESVVDSIANIARGNLSAAKDYVEKTLARILPLVISFLARFVGLGGLSDKIKEVIQKIRAPVDKAIDKVVEWVARQAKSLLAKGVAAGKKVIGAVTQWWKKQATFKTVDGKGHSVTIESDSPTTDLVVKSTPMYLDALIGQIKDMKLKKQAQAKRLQIVDIIKAGRLDKTPALVDKRSKELDTKLTEMAVILSQDKDVLIKTVLPAATFEYKPVGNKAKFAVVRNLSAMRQMGSVPGSAKPVGWEYVRSIGKTQAWPYFRRLHLINHRFGGPGMDSNLAVAGKTDNEKHLYNVENKIKDIVGDLPNQPGKNGVVTEYKVDVKYRNAAVLRDGKTNLSDFPKAFDCTWTYIDTWPKTEKTEVKKKNESVEFEDWENTIK